MTPGALRLLVVVCVLTTGAWSCAQAGEILFFVGPSGDDTADGSSPAQAFRTLERARDAVRESKAAAPEKAHIVELLPGTFMRDRTLQLGKADSGKEGAPVIWRSREPRRAILSGARIFLLSDFAKPEDPGFANPAAFDYSLPEDAEVLQKIPGFQPIPFARIGLYTDQYRTNLPTEARRQRTPEFSPYKEDRDKKFGTQEPI